MSFDYARSQGSGLAIPSVRQLAVSASGANTWLKGAPLILSSGKLVETGANPANIGGIALHDVGTGSGRLYPIGNKEFPPGYAQFMQLESNIVFYALYLGTLPTTVGATYGITKDTDNKWKADFSKSSSNQRLTLIDLDATTIPAGSSGATVLNPRVGVVFSASGLTIDRI